MDYPQTVDLGHHGQISTHVFLIKYSTVLSADTNIKKCFIFLSKRYVSATRISQLGSWSSLKMF